MTKESSVYILHKFVFALDRAADQILQKQFNISHSRALILVVVQGKPGITQHQLALALGRSDPAISALLAELGKDGYVMTTPSPEHLRKRLVTLTPKGEELAGKARQLLDNKFGTLLKNANVNENTFSTSLESLYETLMQEQLGEE